MVDPSARHGPGMWRRPEQSATLRFWRLPEEHGMGHQSMAAIKAKRAEISGLPKVARGPERA